MLKEYLLEAVSLLAEAVLGRPVQARATCYAYMNSNDACGDCFDPECGGGMKRKYKKYCNMCPPPYPPCWTWVYCYCDSC